MIKKITLIAFALSTLAGCSSTLEPVHDKVIPYDNSKSLAYNVATQGGFHYKLNDVDVPKDSVVRTTSAMGHLASTFLFSANFVGSLGLSLTSDDSHGADSSQLILSLDVPKTKGDEYVANYIFDAIRKKDPISEFIDVEFLGGGVVRYKHKGAVCAKAIKDTLELNSESIFFRKILNKGYCDLKMKIVISAPSNERLFPESVGQHTVRVSVVGDIVTLRYLQALPEAYYYSVNLNWLNVPMHVEHKGLMYFFIKPEHGVPPILIEGSAVEDHYSVGKL